VPAKAGRPARTRKQNMELPGIPSPAGSMRRSPIPTMSISANSLKGMVIMGHGGNTVRV